MEPTNRKVSSLVEMVQSGELKLPEIQRSYVWKRTQVRDLVDSLYRDYPSGAIMIWETEELPETRGLEGGGSSGAIHKPLYVLDGQQRLTSLTKVFEGEIDVRFNLETQEFQLASRAIAGDPKWISANAVIRDGAAKALAKLKIGPGDSSFEEFLDRVNRLEAIKNYLYPVHVLRDCDYEQATDIFLRVNSGGTRLRQAELAIAQLAFKLPGMVGRQFEEVLDELEDEGFVLRPPFLVRCLTAATTKQSKFFPKGSRIPRIRSIPDEELTDGWNRTRQGIYFAVNLVKKNLGVESSDWLPSENALVPMVVYLSDKSTVSPQETKKLLRWFLLASVWGRYSASVETALDQDLTALGEEKPFEKLTENVVQRIGRTNVRASDLDGANQNSPFFVLMFLACRNAGAQDWFTGVRISSTNLGTSHSLEIHHVFPKGVIRAIYERKQVDDMANLAFLSQRANRSILASKPRDYLRDLVAKQGDVILRTQYVPTDPALWELDRFPEFLARRRELIVEGMNGFLSTLGP